MRSRQDQRSSCPFVALNWFKRLSISNIRVILQGLRRASVQDPTMEEMLDTLVNNLEETAKLRKESKVSMHAYIMGEACGLA